METKLLDKLDGVIEEKKKEPNHIAFKAALLFVQTEINNMRIDLIKHELKNLNK
jgi:predicted transport protein